MNTPDRRLAAFGHQLIEVHLWLREELAAIRDDLDAGVRPRELRAHCLAFCSALDRHHTGEDGEAFPRLAERFAELRPVLDDLRRDHRLVEDCLKRLRTLLDGDRLDPATVRSEVDTIAALMETHFGYEERRIVAALNSLEVPDWKGDGPDFLRTGDG